MLGRLARWLGISALAAGLAFGATSFAAFAQDKVVIVPSEDAAMEAAIAKARAGLPDFWKAFANPASGTERYSIKVAIRDGDQTEHFWTSDVERQGDKIFATIANEPQMVGNVAEGQRIEVPEADISDWMFRRNGKIVGNETMRVLLNYMPAEEAAQYREMLEEP